MPTIITLVIDNTIEKFTRPRFLKWSLIILLFVAVISQLAVFYFLAPNKIDTAAPVMESIKTALAFQGGIVQSWFKIIEAITLFLLAFKYLVYILAVLVLIIGTIIFIIIPDEWLEIGGTLLLLLLLAAPFVILGLAALEIIPLYLVNGAVTANIGNF